MKIEIDTLRDSPEDIKRAIKMLQSIVGETSTYSSDDSPEPTPGAFNMFGDDSPQTFDDDNEPEEKPEPKVHVVEY